MLSKYMLPSQQTPTKFTQFPMDITSFVFQIPQTCHKLVLGSIFVLYTGTIMIMMIMED